MSSMRNAAPRRSHRERAQPGHRQKWGLLEKHKDYSLRAKDYNEKKAKLRLLEQKRDERHPDEFAFGMLRGDSARQGKHGRGDQNKNRLAHDVVEKLKMQDAGYLRTVLARTRKELEVTKQAISMDHVMRKRTTLGENRLLHDEDSEHARKRQRIVAVEDDNVTDNVGAFEPSLGQEGLDAFEAHDNMAPNLDLDHAPLQRTRVPTPGTDDEAELPKRPTPRQKSKAAEAEAKRIAEKRRRQRLREVRAAKLEMLKKRQKSVLAAADELELQRAKMARVVGGVNKNGVKFKMRERKR